MIGIPTIADFVSTVGTTFARQIGTGPAGSKAFAQTLKSPSGVPPAPTPPPKPSSGDGSGAYDSADPSIGDRVKEQTFYRVAAGADALGLDTAASHMRHYLEGSGDPVTVDVQSMLNDLPSFRDNVDRQFQQDIVGEVNQRIADEWNGEPMNFTVEADWRRQSTGGESDDWFYGLGTFSYSQTADVTVRPGADGQPEVHIDSQLHVFDRYNWDQGKAVDIGPWHVEDRELGRLHEVGLAQEFDVFGSSATQSTDYTYKPSQVGAPHTETAEGFRDNPRLDSPREGSDYRRR